MKHIAPLLGTALLFAHSSTANAMVGPVSVPEPSTLSLLALSGLVMFFRRPR